MFENILHRKNGQPISPEVFRLLGVDSVITEIVAPELMDVDKPQIRTYRRLDANLAPGATAEFGFGDQAIAARTGEVVEATYLAATNLVPLQRQRAYWYRKRSD